MTANSDSQERDVTKITVTYSDGSTEEITHGFACEIERIHSEEYEAEKSDITGTWSITENCDIEDVALLCNDFVSGLLTGIHWDNDISVVQPHQ